MLREKGRGVGRKEEFGANEIPFLEEKRGGEKKIGKYGLEKGFLSFFFTGHWIFPNLDITCQWKRETTFVELEIFLLPPILGKSRQSLFAYIPANNKYPLFPSSPTRSLYLREYVVRSSVGARIWDTFCIPFFSRANKRRKKK